MRGSPHRNLSSSAVRAAAASAAMSSSFAATASWFRSDELVASRTLRTISSSRRFFRAYDQLWRQYLETLMVAADRLEEAAIAVSEGLCSNKSRTRQLSELQALGPCPSCVLTNGTDSATTRYVVGMGCRRASASGTCELDDRRRDVNRGQGQRGSSWVMVVSALEQNDKRTHGLERVLRDRRWGRDRQCVGVVGREAAFPSSDGVSRVDAKCRHVPRQAWPPGQAGTQRARGAPSEPVVAARALRSATTVTSAILIAVIVLHRHFRSHHLRSRNPSGFPPTRYAKSSSIGGHGEFSRCRQDRGGDFSSVLR